LTDAAIIVAAGRGIRAGVGLPKQWREIAGRSSAARALAAFAEHPEIATCLLVIHPDDVGLAAPLAEACGAQVVHGGADRAASVRAGLEALAGSGVRNVLIHDAARPFVSAALISRVIAALGRAQGAAPGVAVTDALWQGEGRVGAIVPRNGLHRAQTPQGFRLEAILAAHRAHPGGAADDVEVALAAGLEVAIVPGEEDNFKITAPGDFARAARHAESQAGESAMRIGQGHDVHRFTEGDHVILCGVTIPHTRGLDGHSDADVGMHALTDAIYGALADGDIGRHFPPSDPQWRGAASEIFLAHAVQRAAARGLRIGNADVTLICEEPKIGPHAARMAAELGRIAEVEPSCISVKATTSERLGFTGRGEGIAASAVVLLVPR